MKNKKDKKVKLTSTYRGLVADSDPRYERGWTILFGRNINRPLKNNKGGNKNGKDK